MGHVYTCIYANKHAQRSTHTEPWVWIGNLCLWHILNLKGSCGCFLRSAYWGVWLAGEQQQPAAWPGLIEAYSEAHQAVAIQVNAVTADRTSALSSPPPPPLPY